MKDALEAAVSHVVAELLRADFREDVVNILDAAIEVARGRGVDVGDVEAQPLALYVIDRSGDGMSQSVDGN